MMTLEQIIKRLEHANLSKIAEAVGTSRANMYNLKHQKVNPSYELVKKLSDYFEELEK
ncbi:hypothetical protein [Pseudoalteromonas phage H103]|uniref:transcriptional regulator n=1 Tax=Pseudoalteromonas phage H103 TaxID=1636200 RepID=UPI0006BD8BE7|nr:transcriptional regulator [Pseudoalteromonas phage H103]AKA61234.1 hypothetical protein [Pseudoalteromonas phage H103]